jgi:hypothetical protein
MRLLILLAAALALALVVSGWVPGEGLTTLATMPTPMVLFIVAAALVLTLLALSGRSRRL